MQSDIHAFIILYVNRNLFDEMHGIAVLGLYTFKIGTHYVVIFAGGHALGEFAGMIGIKIPLGLSCRRRDGS